MNSTLPDKRIQDLPQDARPREKAQQHGIDHLSDAELLALFIGTGLPGENAIDVGQRILQKNGNLANLAKLTIKELAKEKGLGPAKSTLLAAAFEMGGRVAKQAIHRTALKSPQQIYDFMHPMFLGLTQESLRAILVDTKMQCIKVVEISKGTVNQTICHPRDVLHHAISHQAAGLILVHNHPSGDPTPSQADNSVTKTLVKACDLMQIKLHDHLIVGSPSGNQLPYYSFREYGKI